MTHQDKTLRFDPDDFSALQDLFGGYLHEDFVEEYGSAVEGVKIFLSDASGDEIQNAKEEWQRLRTLLRGRPFAESQSALHRLGAAWHPTSPSELDALDEILSRA